MSGYFPLYRHGYNWRLRYSYSHIIMAHRSWIGDTDMTLTRYARGYEIVHYGEDANEHLNGVTQIRRFNTDGGAKAFAGRLSKRIKGPVDVAHAGAADWGNRYMTTASPSPYHASGYRFERLD